MSREPTTSYSRNGKVQTHSSAFGSRVVHGGSLRDDSWLDVLHHIRTDACVFALHKLGHFSLRDGALFLLH